MPSRAAARTRARPADRLRAGLGDAVESGAVRFERRAADGVHDWIDLIALAKRVERRERHADLGPQRTEDEFPTPGRMDGLPELGVLPGVDARAVERRAVLEQLGELGNGRLLLA